MQKYSAAFWGTSFVNEMSKIMKEDLQQKESGIATPPPTTEPARAEAKKSDVVEKTVLHANGHANGHVNGTGNAVAVGA